MTKILFQIFLSALFSLTAIASDIRTDVPDFNLEIYLRRGNPQPYLLQVENTGRFNLLLDVTQETCEESESMNAESKLTIGVYPLADQVLSAVLRKVRLGTGNFPKPKNMPELLEWDIETDYDHQEFRERIIKEYKTKEPRLKSYQRLKDTGRVEVTVSKKEACDILRGEIKITATSQFKFKHPDQKEVSMISPEQITQISASLLDLPKPTHYVRSTFAIAKALDARMGSEFSKLQPDKFAQIVNALIDANGALKPLMQETARAISSQLTRFEDVYVQDTITVVNLPKQGDL